RLLLLVVAAIGAGHAASSQRVELVDEDDAGRRFSRLLEQVADTRGTDADKHLDELGARNREIRHTRFPRDRTRKQCLSGARWSEEQHAFGNAGAEPAKRFGIA